MVSLALFESFDKEFYIEEQNIRPIELYKLSYLNSNFHLADVTGKIAKKGETVCNDELVNFLADEKHKNCICASC